MGTTVGMMRFAAGTPVSDTANFLDDGVFLSSRRSHDRARCDDFARVAACPTTRRESGRCAVGTALFAQQVSDAARLVHVSPVEQGNLGVRAESDGYAVAIEQTMRLLQQRTSFWRDDSREIQWIGGADCDEITVPRLVAYRP